MTKKYGIYVFIKIILILASSIFKLNLEADPLGSADG